MGRLQLVRHGTGLVTPSASPSQAIAEQLDSRQQTMFEPCAWCQEQCSVSPVYSIVIMNIIIITTIAVTTTTGDIMDVTL